MPENSLLKKLEGVRRKYESLQQQLSDPSLVQDMKRYVTLNKEYSDIGPVVEAGDKYRNAVRNLASAKELLLTEKDEEMREFAKEEITLLEEQLLAMEQKIKFLLIPATLDVKRHHGDPCRNRETGLHLRRPFGCIPNLLKRKDGKEIAGLSEGTSGGFKEIISRSPTGCGVMKYEQGASRAACPQTKQGRVHCRQRRSRYCPKPMNLMWN